MVCNSRGDVEEIRKADGTLYARYVYDSWGNTVKILDANGNTVTDPDYLSVQNPIRYRGYYWDSESGLYYLQSRYYDPVTGRFVNGDSQLNTDNISGYNMFVYCYNNPVVLSDSEGNRPIVGAGPISKETADERKASCAAVKGRSYSASKSGKSIAKSDKKEKSIINHVNKSHYTEDFGMLNLGYIFGKVGFSSTTTIYQDKEPALFYTFADVGNVDSKYGGGFNVASWIGVAVGGSSELHLFVDAQITPILHVGLTAGLDGLGGIVGVDIGNTAYDFEIKGGFGLLFAWILVGAPQYVVELSHA